MNLHRALLTWTLLPACVILGACSSQDTGAEDASGGTGAGASGGTGAGGNGTGAAGGTVGAGGNGTGAAGGTVGAGGNGTGAAGGTVGAGGTIGAGGTVGAGGTAGAAGSGAGGTAGSTGGGSDDLSGVEVVGEGCALPATWPTFAELQNNEKFLDPFTMIDGTKVTTKAQWACRNREIRALVEHWETGPKEGKEATVTGSFASNAITVNVKGGAADVSFSATVELPSTGTAPYPAMMMLGGSLDKAKLKALGVAIINYDHNGVQPEGNRSGGIYQKFNGNTGTGALMSWAWGASRIIDALEVTPGAQIDPTRLGVTGCSRNGKGALMVGAMDARFALVVPQESGSGGVASWRVSEEDNMGQTGSAGVQNLTRTYGEAAWFGTMIEQFGNAVDKLPLDHHLLVAMVAPRGMHIIGNTGYTWLSTNNADQAGGAARLVYQALGVKDNLGYIDTNHSHCGALPANQQAAVDAYVKKFLLDDASVNTSTHWDPVNELNTAKWVDWTAPASLQ